MGKGVKIDWEAHFNRLKEVISSKLLVQRSNLAEIVIGEINAGNGAVLAENLALVMCVEKCNFLQNLVDKSEEIKIGAV